MILDSCRRVSSYIYPKRLLFICWSFTSYSLQPWCRSCSCANCAAGLRISGALEHHQRDLPNVNIQAELQWFRKLELHQKKWRIPILLPLPGFLFTWCDYNPTLNCGVPKICIFFIHFHPLRGPECCNFLSRMSQQSPHDLSTKPSRSAFYIQKLKTLHISKNKIYIYRFRYFSHQIFFPPKKSDLFS